MIVFSHFFLYVSFKHRNKLNILLSQYQKKLYTYMCCVYTIIQKKFSIVDSDNNKISVFRFSIKKNVLALVYSKAYFFGFQSINNQQPIHQRSAILTNECFSEYSVFFLSIRRIGGTLLQSCNPQNKKNGSLYQLSQLKLRFSLISPEYLFTIYVSFQKTRI